MSGGAYWRITVKERVIYLGNFSQTIFGRCSAGEDAAAYIYIYIAPLLIHFAGLPILSNLVALSVSHTRFHLTGLSSNRFKSAFASVIPYRPPLSSLSPRVEKDFWTRGRSEENSATRRRIKFNRVLLRRIGRKVFGSIWLVLCFMIVGIFFVSSNKSLSLSLSPPSPFKVTMVVASYRKSIRITDIYIIKIKTVKYYFINYIEANFFFTRGYVRLSFLYVSRNDPLLINPLCNYLRNIAFFLIE